LAFWTAILFSVHPVHVEPLGGIVGRADLLAAFVLLSACYFVPFNDSIENYLIIFLLSILGSLFKENGIMITVFT